MIKTKMSFDGLQTVEVPLQEAIRKAEQANDEHNLLMLKNIRVSIEIYNRITKSDYDYVKDYLS
jgi:hypothetical protein